MAATQPQFTTEFNVEGDWAKYNKITSDLRDQLKDPKGPSCFGLPVLPIEIYDLKASREQWFAMVLETSKKKITLRLRLQNLYLDAYQKADGKWVEYVSKAGRLYPQSESQVLLECDGGYAALGKDMGGAKARKTIPTGKEELMEAVNNLAELSDGSTIEARKYQIVVIEMICESLRLKNITQFLAAGDTHVELPDWMVAIMVRWGTLSRALLAAAAGGGFSLPKRDSKAIGIETKEQAIAATGIVKPQKEAPPPTKVAADRIQYSNYKTSLFAQSMVEVFELRIERIEGKSKAKLYGTLTVDEVFTQFLFSRGRTDPESVYPGFTPLLTGPADEFICASDSFAINIDLRDADTDKEISKGTIEWNVYNLGPGKDYDRFIQGEVPGTYGSATISYAVFSSAVSATIEITLINGDGEDPANVYGEVVASNTSISQGQSVLFLKEKEQNVDVRPGQLIPLSRSIVAVPTNSYLNVHAELWDYDVISFNDEIANGTASFQPQMEGTSTKRISGKYGEIEVKVTWDKEY